MAEISVTGAPAPRLLLLSGVIGLLALAVLLAALNGAARWADGYVAFRAPAEIDARFWAAWATGLIAALLSSWVWVLKPRDPVVRLYALSGAATLAFCFAGAALLSLAALPETVMWALIVLNVAAACAFGVIMIALLSSYPAPLTGARWIVWASIVVFGGWTLLGLSDPPSLFINVHRITLAEMALIVLVSGAQVLAARGDPVRFAIAAWLGVCVLLGAGGFIATVSAPSAFGAPPLIANEYAFGFFLIIYAGLAVGLLRYRVFGLGRWAFQILFSAAAALCLVLVDALLIAALSFDPSAVIGLSLFVAALLYLPLRAWFWSRLTCQRPLDQAALARAMIDIGMQPTPVRRAEKWRALLERLYAPLTIAPHDGGAGASAHIEEEGRVLVTPMLTGFPSLMLRDRDRGRALFGPDDAATVNELLALAAYLNESRAAFERGAAAERARMARDIHDNIGAQLLSALHIRDGARKDELIRDAIGEFRAVISNATGEQQSFGDVTADLRAETMERLEAKGLDLDWRVDGAPVGAMRPVAVFAMRALVREAVSNILRHAGAKRVDILIAAEGAELRLRIVDDGIGLKAGESAGQGRGLANMRQRVASLGGRFSIEDGARGTVIEAAFPVFSSVSEPEPRGVPGGFGAG